MNRNGGLTAFTVDRVGACRLEGDVVRGEGPTALVLHGLTAHRGLVLMGSRKLEREGWTVISFDARGHGTSGAPVRSDDYGYGSLVADAVAVLDQQARAPAVLIGASMGAHTAAALVLERPDLCRGLVLLTPAFDGAPADRTDPNSDWLDLADALDSGGVEAFVEVLAAEWGGSPWAAQATEAARQRMSRHADIGAVARALREVPFSSPLQSIADLESLSVPTIVVGSRDDADPRHPLAVARQWANLIPGARLAVEAEGESPLAWRGAKISELALEVAGPTE